jgi:hypothetical protein
MGIETIAIAGLIGSAISGVTGFIGAQQQAAATSEAANYQAQVARNNEIIAAQNAQYAAQAGATQAQAQDLKNRATVGGILASQGASGIDIESGSSQEVRRSAAQLGRLDTETIYSNALQTARSNMAQASNFGAQAKLSDFTARNARSAGLLSGFSSLLGGASSFSEKWMKYSNAGIF